MKYTMPEESIIPAPRGRGRLKGQGGENKIIVTPEMVQEAQRFAAQGVGRGRVHGKLHMSRKAFFDALKRNPELKEAIEAGEASFIADVEMAMFTNATSMSVDKMGLTYGTPGGNVEIQKFIIARRGGKQWREVKDDGNGEQQQGGSVKVVIMLPDNGRSAKVIDV